MTSLNVQFSPFPPKFPECKEIQGPANRAMFYVANKDPGFFLRLFHVFHKVEAVNGPNKNSQVEWIPEKYNAPRDAIGEGFQIPLSERGKELNAETIAIKLRYLCPPPNDIDTGSQWWVLSNLIKLEEKGLVQPGTSMSLLADPRMDSTSLQEFQPLKDALNRTRASSANGITPEQFSNVVAQFPTPDFDKRDRQWWISRILLKLEELGYMEPGSSTDFRHYMYRWLEFPTRDAKNELQKLFNIDITVNDSINMRLDAEDKYMLEELRQAITKAGIASEMSDTMQFAADSSHNSENHKYNRTGIPEEYFF